MRTTRAIALVAMLAVTSAALAAPRDAVRRDVEGYAMASCFTALDDPALKDQGDAWGSAIVQRGRGDISAFLALRRSVLRAMALKKVPVVQDPARPMASKPLPLMYCAEIVDVATVRTAIDRAIAKLASAYRRR